jgi:PKD repeat protein
MEEIIIDNSGKKYFTPLSVSNLEDSYVIETIWILDYNVDVVTLTSKIIKFCEKYDLSVQHTDDPYNLKVIGNNLNFYRALKIYLYKYKLNEGTFHAPQTPIRLPGYLNGVKNILGFNNMKMMTPNFRLTEEFTRSSKHPFTPLEVAKLYNFPTNSNGEGQKIGIIQLGGGYRLLDLHHYLESLGIYQFPVVNDISVDGGVNNINDNSGANVEVSLDLQIIASIVPSSNINVYFAPNNEKGFYNAISKAIQNQCNIISISWGITESFLSNSVLSTFNSLFQYASSKNITILAASGDRGSSDGYFGNNVNFPSSSPFILACGGTTLYTDDGNTISNEIVWNNSSTTSATGGGFSSFFSKPDYQNNINYNFQEKRGVPDISGNADPYTGYKIYLNKEEGEIVVGGTSAVSPLLSGLIARLNHLGGSPIGFFHDKIYKRPEICRDITIGNNGSYNAGLNWDPCTGNGTPNGDKILKFISGEDIPNINFTASENIGILPLKVDFTDLSTKNIISWYWNFGDGNNSTIQNPSHTYDKSGKYAVTLTATNEFGSNTLTKNNYIIVSNPPIIADFTVNKIEGYVPLTINFNDTSTQSPNKWLWDFGDYYKSYYQNPTHTYYYPGTFTVSLNSSNLDSSDKIIKTNLITVLPKPAPKADFTVSNSLGNSPFSVNFTDTSTGSPTFWIWDFGDYYRSYYQNPSHVYTKPGVYSVSLTVYNSVGSNKIIKSNIITVITVPIAEFKSNITSGTSPVEIIFYDLSKNNPTFWVWDFGDGNTSSLQNPTHLYQNNGNFTVKLTVGNTLGENTIIKDNYIQLVEKQILPPVAQFSFNNSYGRNPLSVSFIDKSTNDPINWVWDFGDGEQSNQNNPTHVYQKSGFFTVSLTVSNLGGIDTEIKYNIIRVQDSPPIANFSASPLKWSWSIIC